MTANATHVSVPKEELATLRTLLDEMHQQLDETRKDRDRVATEMTKAIETRDADYAKTLGELNARAVKDEAELTAMKTRLEAVDAVMSKGAGLYGQVREEDIPGIVCGVRLAGRQMTTVRQFGECVQDAFMLWTGRAPKYGHITRDQTVGDNTKGGHGVPRPLWDGVFHLLPQLGFGRRFCTVTEMDSETLDVNTSTAYPAVSWPGEATAPGSESSVLLTDPRPKLTAKELVSTNGHSMKLLETALPSVLAFIGMRHMQAHALEEDRQVLVASADPFTGVFVADGVGQHVLGTGSVSFHQFDHGALISTIDAADEQLFMDPGEGTNLRWAAHPQFYHNCKKKVDTQGRPMFGDMAGSIPKELEGYAYSRSIKAPKQSGNTASKVFAAFGDFSFVMIGDLMKTAVAFSEHEEFSKARVKMRVLAMVGVLVVLPPALSRIKTAAS